MIREINKNESLPMELLLMADPAEEIVKEYVSRGQVYLLEKDSRIIGVYVLVPTRPETVELMNIAVDEVYQGEGFGKQMVEHATAAAKEQGCKIMDVGTASLGVEQLMFYQKCGFRMTSIDHDFFVKHYDAPIIITGIRLRDMVRLSIEF